MSPKSLRAYVGGTSANEELARIPGRLYIVRPLGVKSSNECIFIDAFAAIRKTSREFNTELVVTRAWSQGEQELVQEEDDTKKTVEEERPFLIDESLRFAARPSKPQDSDEPGSVSFTWLDRTGDLEDTYLFVCDPPQDGKKDAIEVFVDAVYRACYERKYSSSAAAVPEDDLAEFVFESTTAEPTLFRPETPSDDETQIEDELTSHVKRLSIGGDDSASAGSPARAPAPPPPSMDQMREKALSTFTLPPDDRKLLLSEAAEICLYDRATAMFMSQDKEVQANLWTVQKQRYPCWLSVSGSKADVWVSTPIDNQMVLTFNEHELSLIFNFVHQDYDEKFTWLIRVPNKEAWSRLNTAFARGLFEGSFGRDTWSRLSREDQRYNEEMYVEDVEMANAEESEEEEEEEVYSDVESSQGATDREDEEDRVTSALAEKSKNSQLAVGHLNDLSFVVRGDMIGVFQSQTGTGRRLKFMTSISGVGTPDGKRTFEPGKVMLHEQDSSMIISDPLNPTSLYKLDLGTGRVIEELKINESIDIKNFLPDTKYAQTTNNHTFIGTSRNSVFRVDPRLSGSKLVDSQFKQYATKTDFSAAATTEKGGLVVGSDKGELRLFDALGKNAKTALPSVGAPVIGVDVSSDGKWIVATTPTFLLLIDATIKDGRYKDQLGFDRSFPASAKPVPRRLTLRPEHAQYLTGPINFTPARFNAGHDSLERSIVTSTGEYVIAWNFRKVKAGQLDSYQIKRYDDTIVADGFKWGADREIVVVQPKDVFVEQKNGLQRPTRASLAPSVVKRWGD